MLEVVGSDKLINSFSDPKINWKSKIADLIFSVPFPSIYHSHNFSTIRLGLAKLGILWSFTFSRLFIEKPNAKGFSGTINKRGCHAGLSALVVGNGPSSTEINWEAVQSARVKGELLLFLVNYSLNDETFGKLESDYLVLSDPECHPRNNQERTAKLWQKISQLPRLKLITPVTWRLSSILLECQTDECLHFSDLSLETFSNSISPLKARGYPSMTAYKALAFANFMGFDLIYISGIDNSMFRSIRVDSSNRIQQDPNYFVQGYGPTTDVSDSYPEGIGDYFYELSAMFLSLRRCFGRIQVINLGLNSEVDAFPKVQIGTSGYRFLKK